MSLILTLMGKNPNISQEDLDKSFAEGIIFVAEGKGVIDEYRLSIGNDISNMSEYELQSNFITYVEAYHIMELLAYIKLRLIGMQIDKDEE